MVSEERRGAPEGEAGGGQGLAWLSSAQTPATWHMSEPGWAEELTRQVRQLVPRLLPELSPGTIQKKMES